MTDNRNRTALVTGGIQGLGAAQAKALGAAGYNVAVTYLGSPETAQAFYRDTMLPVYEWDVSDFNACEAGVARVEEEVGAIDILVNNAGVNRDAIFHKMSREDWDAVIDVDLGSMFNMCRQVIGGMRRRGFGRIVNLSSVNALKGQAGQTNYCAAKAGIIGFTKALARECSAKGVTVNAIAPGYADTPMVAKMPERIRDEIINQSPMQRLARPEEIARCVVFLASDDAAFITGETLSVNGGQYMN